MAHLIFDLDGVLVDSRVPISRSINHALELGGLPRQPDWRLYPLIGPPLHGAFETLLGDIGGDPASAGQCVERYREYYAEVSLTDSVLFPGVAQVLRAVGAHHSLAVATSKPEAFAVPILRSLGIWDAFELVAGPSLDALAEAKAATLGRALEGLGVERGGSAVMIGDRSHDVVAGRANGVATLGVTWGIGTREELLQAGADALVDAPAALPAAARALCRVGV